MGQMHSRIYCRGHLEPPVTAVKREALVAEAKLLMDFVAKNHTSLAASEMWLDTSMYTDREQFSYERDKLFRHYPLCIGPSALLKEPGDYWTFNDTGVPVVVARTQSGELKAHLNICSHRSSPVAIGQGHLKGKMFSCPYHAWTYTLEGKLRGIPGGAEGFPCVKKDEMSLVSVPVMEQNGLIFVQTAPGSSFDVAAVEAGIGADLLEFGLRDHYLLDTVKIPVRQNWKSLLEGYHDFYHFTALHPTTIGARAYNNIGHYRQFSRNHVQSSPNLNINELKHIAEHAWEPRRYMSFVYYIFPATVFFVVEDHFQLWRVYPVDEQNSVVYQSIFLPKKPETPAEEQRFRDFFSFVTKVVIEEDYMLGQLIQRGLEGGAHRRVCVGRNEIAIQNFYRQIADLTGRPSGATTHRALPSVA